ncbi:AAA family ATPase [Nocardia pseudobrasiliensis]|uniref:Broad-specificity NMP kinase n=1 Tax=Nocardia pseudobrasiliensis TaxID=45979 RepID=A0A370ICR7_9NOCA|nr:AAA family ATPase [Nocardia pseudobrasiliensis]RDI68508.1 broad-specificity NMP kinase [Nocardia pseudobrasiliensis]
MTGSVLWLTGAPGVGKSTAGWGLFMWARAAGRAVAYVDIDQLGLLAPVPEGDVGYHRIKAGNLVEVVEVFRRHGVEQVIVSGVVDPVRGIAPYVGDLDITLVRLRCTAGELRRRYLGRGSSGERVVQALEFSDLLDRNGIGVPLDITTLSPEAVVDALSERIGTAAQGNTVPPTTETDGFTEPLPVLLLLGPTAVGKSAVGWEVLRTLWDRDLPAAFIDAEQLGFHPDGSGPNIKAQNLLRVWHGYRRAGARALIVVTRGQPEPFTRALCEEFVTTVRLDASPEELAKRIAQRAHGQGPGLAGDSLIGASAERQTRTGRRADAEARTLRRNTDGIPVIETDGADIASIAAELADFMIEIR